MRRVKRRGVEGGGVLYRGRCVSAGGASATARRPPAVRQKQRRAGEALRGEEACASAAESNVQPVY